MKILKQTITQLKIENHSISGGLLNGIGIIAGGLLCLTLTYNSTTLSCQRIGAKEGNCELTRTGLLGSKTEEISLINLQGAKVEASDDTSRVVLLTNSGEVPFTYYSSSWGDKDSLASDVNSFVKNTEHRLLKLTQDDRWMGAILFGIMLPIGLGLIAFAKNETYNFDKTFGKMTVKQSGLMMNKVTEHSIREISGVELDETKDSDGDITCKVKLLMPGGDRICLSIGSDREEQQKIAELVRSYLNARSA